MQETPASTCDKPRIPAPCIRLLEELCLQRDLVRQPPPPEERDSSSPNPVDSSDEQDDDSSDDGRPSLMSGPVLGPIVREKRAREVAHAAPSRDSGSSVCQDDRETRRLRRSSTLAVQR